MVRVIHTRVQGYWRMGFLVLAAALLAGSAWAQPEPQPPSLSVTKTADTCISKVGDCVRYTITVKNTGADPLIIAAIDDTLLQSPDFDVAGDFVGVLLCAGQSRTKTYSYIVPPCAPDPLTNTVTVTAFTECGRASATAEASAVVDLVHPALTVAKCVDVGSACVGQTVTFTVRITNTGDVPLTNVNVNDPLLGGPLYFFPYVIYPGQTFSQNYPYTITSSDADPICNTVTACANPVGLPNLITSSASASVRVLPAPNPRIAIWKNADRSSALVGDTICYTITIKNGGNCRLVGIVVEDNLLGTLYYPGVLDPGQSARRMFYYKVKCTDRSPLVNNVRVSAWPATPCATAQVCATARATVCISRPSLMIIKKANVAYADPGQTISYSISIKNAGDVRLTNVMVADSLPGTFNALFPTYLVPGQLATRTFCYTVKPSDPNPVVNCVMVRACVYGTQTYITSTASASTPRRNPCPPPCPTPNPGAI